MIIQLMNCWMRSVDVLNKYRQMLGSPIVGVLLVINMVGVSHLDVCAE